MGMMNDTITVYNKYLASNVERWKRTVLSGVYWNAVNGAVLRKTGAASADSVVVIVPRSLPGYVKPKTWNALPDKSGAWTVQAGDMIVKGRIATEITRSAAKELSGYDDVLTVTTVDDKDFGGLAHLEVSGR